MMIRNGLFSSESVSEGHPDKLADRISDRILDAFLERDPHARVACETLLADQFVVVAGEFKTANTADFAVVRDAATSLVRQVLRDSGYSHADTGIDPDRCEGMMRISASTRCARRSRFMSSTTSFHGHCESAAADLLSYCRLWALRTKRPGPSLEDDAMNLPISSRHTHRRDVGDSSACDNEHAAGRVSTILLGRTA